MSLNVFVEVTPVPDAMTTLVFRVDSHSPFWIERFTGTFMAAWREDEKSMANARHAKEVMEMASMVAHSAVVSAVTVGQTVTFSEAVDGPTGP